MTDGFLLQAIVYLSAAVICVPIAKRLGMGSVLGYIAAGILIGPFVLGFVGSEGEGIMHFAEFGVVIMLFLIGLELEPVSVLEYEEDGLWCRAFTGGCNHSDLVCRCHACGLSRGMELSRSVWLSQCRLRQLSCRP